MQDKDEMIRQLRERVSALNAEVGELRARQDGDEVRAHSYLQARCLRQSAALDRLNRKVLTQRFRLRLLASLGRDVTYDEYIAARDEAGNDRIGDYETLVA